MNLQMITFLVVSLAIIFSAHFAIYKSWVIYLNIDDSSIKKIIAIVLFLLSVSFIISSILLRNTSNILIKITYFVSAYWSGLLIYLLLSAFLTWLIVLILKHTGLNYNQQYILVMFTALSIAFSIIGLVSSLNPKIKEFDVKIKNLPLAWEGKSLVQISDMHLGLIYNGRFADKIIRKINQINPEIVLFTGDYFDGTCPKLDNLAEPLNDLLTKNAYFISGNHETYIGIDKVQKVQPRLYLKLI